MDASHTEGAITDPSNTEAATADPPTMDAIQRADQPSLGGVTPA